MACAATPIPMLGCCQGSGEEDWNSYSIVYHAFSPGDAILCMSLGVYPNWPQFVDGVAGRVMGVAAGIDPLSRTPTLGGIVRPASPRENVEVVVHDFTDPTVGNSFVETVRPNFFVFFMGAVIRASPIGSGGGSDLTMQVFKFGYHNAPRWCRFVASGMNLGTPVGIIQCDHGVGDVTIGPRAGLLDGVAGRLAASDCPPGATVGEYYGLQFLDSIDPRIVPPCCQ